MAKKVIKKVIKEEPVKVKEEVKEEPKTEEPVKKKRVMTPEQLQHLVNIRQLAAKKKAEMKDISHKAKAVEEEKLKLKADEYDKIQEQKKKLQELPEEEPEEEKPKEKKLKKKVKKIIEESSDDDNSSVEEVVVRRKKKDKKLTDIDDPTIHHLAYQASQHKLLNKVMSDRINSGISNYGALLQMRYH